MKATDLKTKTILVLEDLTPADCGVIALFEEEFYNHVYAIFKNNSTTCEIEFNNTNILNVFAQRMGVKYGN